jgi:hypothetical protein
MGTLIFNQPNGNLRTSADYAWQYIAVQAVISEINKITLYFHQWNSYLDEVRMIMHVYNASQVANINDDDIGNEFIQLDPISHSTTNIINSLKGYTLSNPLSVDFTNFSSKLLTSTSYYIFIRLTFGHATISCTNIIDTIPGRAGNNPLTLKHSVYGELYIPAYPTEIFLSNNKFDETIQINGIIGGFTTETDHISPIDPLIIYTYEILSQTVKDNTTELSIFGINSDNNLITLINMNTETDKDFSIKIKTTNTTNTTNITQIFILHDKNIVKPTDIILETKIINPSIIVNIPISGLSTTGATDTTYVYSILYQRDHLNSDVYKFGIKHNKLMQIQSINYENNYLFHIRIRTTDPHYNLSYSRIFNIYINNITDIHLSELSFKRKVNIGYIIGKISVIGNNHINYIYTLAQSVNNKLKINKDHYLIIIDKINSNDTQIIITITVSNDLFSYSKDLHINILDNILSNSSIISALIFFGFNN